MISEFVPFLQAVFFFIELVIYKCICNALISDDPSNDQKMRQQRQLIIKELYNNVMKTTVKY